jgi:hypothetical protein
MQEEWGTLILPILLDNRRDRTLNPCPMFLTGATQAHSQVTGVHGGHCCGVDTSKDKGATGKVEGKLAVCSLTSKLSSPTTSNIWISGSLPWLRASENTLEPIIKYERLG